MERVYLLVGGGAEERLKTAKELAGKYQAETWDFLLVEPIKTIGIEEIRELKKKLSLKPFASLFKVALINEAEKLTIEAQNALLKILEEPPSHTIIILTAPSTDSLLPTVVSRCEIRRLSREKKRLTEEELGFCLSALEQIFKGSLFRKFKIAKEAAATKDKAFVFTEQMLLTLKELLMIRFSLSNFKVPTPARLQNLTVQDLANLIRRFERIRKIIEKNINPRLALDNL